MGLIERIAAFLGQWIVATPSQLIVIATWIASTHFVERWQAVPYLQLSSTMPGTGKTTVLRMIELLAPLAQRPMIIRPAAIVRDIAQSMAAHDGTAKLVLLFDEAERLSASKLDDTRSCIATGYARGATWPVSRGLETIHMPSFCFKAFALIGDLQPVIRARSIMVDLEPGQPARSFTDESTAAAAEAKELAAELVAAAKRTNGAYRVADWLKPFGPRHVEIWTPIMTTAALLGANARTVATLESASMDLTSLHRRDQRPHLIDRDRAADSEHARMSLRLLADAAGIVRADDAAERNVFSADLLAALKLLPLGAWRTWPNETGLDERAMAGLLERVGVTQPRSKPDAEPSPVQRGKGKAGRKMARGYRKADILAAAERLAK